MYIIKNAFRCIGRSKGRNILIGIIALVIAISACIGLSIRQASENAKTTALTACQFEQTHGVVDAEINDSGELILIYQDGTEQNLGVVVGKDGSDGVNGEDGALVIDGYESVVSAASAKGLRSAVSIVCNFKATVQQGGWRPGYYLLI